MDIPFFATCTVVCAVISVVWLNDIHAKSIEHLQLQPERQAHIANILPQFPVGRTVVRIETPALSRLTGQLVTNTEVWSYDGLTQEWVEVWQTNDISQLFLSATNSLTNISLLHVRTNYVLRAACTNWTVDNGLFRPHVVNPYTNVVDRWMWDKTNNWPATAAPFGSSASDLLEFMHFVRTNISDVLSKEFISTQGYMLKGRYESR